MKTDKFRIQVLKAPISFKSQCVEIEYFGATLTVPKGYPHIATDKDGSLRAYEKIPQMSEGFGVWLNMDFGAIRLAHVEYRGDWRHSLLCSIDDKHVTNHTDLINKASSLRNSLLNDIAKIDALNAKLLSDEITESEYADQLKLIRLRHK